jgi:hypothetical protein
MAEGKGEGKEVGIHSYGLLGKILRVPTPFLALLHHDHVWFLVPERQQQDDELCHTTGSFSCHQRLTCLRKSPQP